MASSLDAAPVERLGHRDAGSADPGGAERRRGRWTARTVAGRAWPALATEGAALALVLALAVAVRVVGLADPTDVSDEGIRGIQLRLLAAGFRPVSEIYASQGPLSLWFFAPLVALLGPDILAGRLTAVLASLVAIGGSYVVARRLGGPVAAVTSAAILALSPPFLEVSRLAFVEVPSLAPTIVGLLAVSRYRRTARRRWLVWGAVLLALGVLAKPMAVVAGVPVAVLLLARRAGPAGLHVAPGAATGRRARLADVGLFATVGVVVCAATVVAVGPAALYEQMVAYRIGARAVRGWDLLVNARTIADELARHGWGVILAVGVGVAALAGQRTPLAIAVVAWLAGALALMLAYSPLWPKHVAYAMPPLAILAGVGLAQVGQLVVARRRPVRMLTGAAALVAASLAVVAAPTIAGDVRSEMFRHAGTDLRRYADDLRIVEAASRPGEFVVIDDAYLGMTTGRLVPPLLADLSWNRILARALTGEQAIEATRQFDARVIVVQDDHLGQVQRYLAWADREYVLVKSYAQKRPVRFRRVYVHRDVNRGPIREALRAGLGTPTDVELGPARLLGYDLERRDLRNGSRVALTLMFEAMQDRPPEHALIVRLRNAAGDEIQSTEWRVGDGGQELHTWRAGDWQSQTMSLLVDGPPGDYALTLALQRPRGATAPVMARSGADRWRSSDELDLGPVSIVR